MPTRKDQGELLPFAQAATKLVKQVKQIRRVSSAPTPIEQRLIDAAAEGRNTEAQTLLYQHTVFCQTSLPYRDPGDDARTWERLNGGVHLKVLAGEAMHPVEGKLVPVGLPFGPKSRLVLMHINQRAIVTESATIEVEDSLSKFVRKGFEARCEGPQHAHR